MPMTDKEYEVFKELKKSLIDIDLDLYYYWHEDTNSIFNGSWIFALVYAKDSLDLIESTDTLEDMMKFIKKEMEFSNIRIEVLYNE